MRRAQTVNGLPSPGNLVLPLRSMEAKPCLLLPCRSTPPLFSSSQHWSNEMGQ
jgi:hypothetical protein